MNILLHINLKKRWKDSEGTLKNKHSFQITRASLRSEKDYQNIDIYREFIAKCSLFGNVGKQALMLTRGENGYDGGSETCGGKGIRDEKRDL